MEKNREIKKRPLYKNFTNYVKDSYNSKNIIIRLGVMGLYFIKKTLHTVKMICTNKEFRALFYMRTFKSKNVHQTTPLTCMNRYPKIFSECKNYFKNREDIKILSYGCSTGEEVLTLRQYFTNAIIVGAEINKNSLKICRSHAVDNKIKFINSTPREIKKNGKFDIIFCMAVLQRTPGVIKEQGITSLKDIYPFEKFEQQIIELDSYVKKGGLMVVHFSQYAFEDTNISSKYKSLGECNQDEYNSAIFDKNSNLINEKTIRKSIFIKVED